MSVKVGINGFGRIGRLVFRIALENGKVDVVAVNDPFIDLDYMAYMLRYDTVHGQFKGDIDVCHDTKSLIVNGKAIKVYACRDPKEIPWKDAGAEYIAEATGVFTSSDTANAHLAGGAKKVVITAPAKDKETPMFVMGVNNEKYTKDMTVVSNASCTTNCLAPAAKIVHERFGIVNAVMTTIHSYTNDQVILDQGHKKEMRRSRAAGLNIIPTTTGAAKAVALVIPELKGKFDGYSLRVPTPTVSIVDFVAVVEKATTKDELNAAFTDAANGALKGILGVTTGKYMDPLVSMDFKGDPRSSIVDLPSNMVMGGTLLKVVTWYDNEWGYSCRTADLAAKMAKSL